MLIKININKWKIMKKSVIIGIISVVVVVAIIVGVCFIVKNNDAKETQGKVIATVEDMQALVDDIYANIQIELPGMMTQVVDVTDQDMVTMMTGLTNSEGIEQIVVSEPMMTSQAYSFVLVKTKEGANVDEMKKSMLDNIDVRKWICVSAEKVYVTNYNDIICLVMSSEDRAKPVYEQFKASVGGKVGTELERTEQM